MDQNFKYADENVKKTIISLLITFSGVDGDYDPAELEIIKIIANNLGYTKDDISNIYHQPDHFEYTLPDNVPDRLKIFLYILFLINVDHVLDDAELDLVKQIGVKLCYNILLIDDLIDFMEEHRGDVVPDAQLEELIKKYLN